MGALPGWAELEAAVPQIAATMRRCLTQIGCVLRPGSVGGADLALRCFAAFPAQAAPQVTSIAQVTRRHIEDYKPWLAARPGQNKPRLTPGTMICRLGTLRMFFIRIDEWAWAEAPPKVPMFTGDLPRTDHPLPRALDDGAAARLLPPRKTTPGCCARHRGDAAAGSTMRSSSPPARWSSMAHGWAGPAAWPSAARSTSAA
jgi:hypothetical protein